MELFFGLLLSGFIASLVFLACHDLLGPKAMKRLGWILACYVIVGLLLSAYSSQRTCFDKGSECVFRAGAIWPFDLIWAGAKFVTMPRDLHLPSIKWE